MKRSSVTVLLAVLLWSTSTGASETRPRLLSLDLCSDWMLARFAPAGQVVALSDYIRQYPVEWVSQDWPTHDGRLETILKLQPDIVISGEYNAILLRQRLSTLGIRTEVLPLPTSLEQISIYEQRVMELIGDHRAVPAETPDVTASGASGRRLLILGANGIGTGRGTFEDSLLTRSGWHNYLDEEGYIQLDLEQVVADPPDAVLWASPSSEALANRFSEHPALRRMIPADRWLTTDYWRWQCPGPWSRDLIAQLEQWID